MTTTQAIATARREITMYRQEHGWRVSYPCYGAWMVSNEMSHAEARERVRKLRIAWALDLLGFDDVYAAHSIIESGDRFEVAVREAMRDRQ